MSKKNRCRNTVTVGRTLGRIEFQSRFVVGIIKDVSHQTRTDLLNCLGRIGRAMESYGLESVKSIDSGFIDFFFAGLYEKGLSPRRIATHVRAMRMMCTIMDKGHLVPIIKYPAAHRVEPESPEVLNEQK